MCGCVDPLYIYYQLLILLYFLAESILVRHYPFLHLLCTLASSGWLEALQQYALGIAISPHNFTIALRLWLGIPLFPFLSLD